MFYLVPFNTKYHRLYGVQGTVISVSNVLSESGGELTRTPVVALDSLDSPLVINDPRAVNLMGKAVKLTCEIEWVYRAADRYSCLIYEVR